MSRDNSENECDSDNEEDEIKPLNKNILKTSCKHYFHRKCIYEWVKKEVFCPICRKELVETINIEDENYLKIIDCCPDVKNVLWCVVITSSKKTNCVYRQKIMNPKLSNLLKDVDDDSTSSCSSCTSSCSSPSTSSENSFRSDSLQRTTIIDPNTTVRFENSITMEEIRNYYSNNSVLRRIQDSHINENLENNNTQPRRNFFNIFRFFKKRTSTQTSQEQVSSTRSFRRYSRSNSRIFL
jgi:ribosomal protein S27E